MPEIMDEATEFLSRIWTGGLGDIIRESLESSGSNVSAIESSKTLAKTKRIFDDYMSKPIKIKQFLETVAAYFPK